MPTAELVVKPAAEEPQLQPSRRLTPSRDVTLWCVIKRDWR